MIRAGILAALVLGVLIVLALFHVRKVEVHGNTRHSGNEIAAGLTEDFLSQNTLYLLWKYRKGTVPETLPYLGSFSIRMKSPSTVEVQVTEKDVVGCIDQGDYIYFDQSGLVLEISDELFDGIPVVTGVSTDEAVLYQKLPTKSSAQLRTILSLTQLLAGQGLSAKEIRFGENMDITVYIGSVEATLGQDEYLEEKIANLRAILERLDGQESGTLHLESFTGKNESFPFTPSDETEPQGSGDGDGGDGISGDADGTGDGASGNADGTGDGASGNADGASGNADGTGDGASDNADGAGDNAPGNADGAGDDASGQDGGDGADGDEDDAGTGVPIMVFNSSGTLVYNVTVVNGVAVDANGTPVDGVTINEDGNVVDAYQNIIDPKTGEVLNLN